MNGFLIATGVCFVLTLLSFLAGSYNVDKYLELTKLTKQQGPVSRAVMRIGMYFFILPSVLLFFAMKSLQIYLITTGKQVAVQSLEQELVTQTGGVTLFLVTFGILLIAYVHVLILFQFKKKAIFHAFGFVVFSLALIFLTQTIVISLMIVNILILGLTVFTYKRLQNQQYRTSTKIQI